MSQHRPRTSRALAVSAIALLGALAAGCGEDYPDAHFDVRVDERGLYVTGYETAQPDACTPRGFAEPGTCPGSSDELDCHGLTPLDWVGSVRLERGADLLDERSFDSPFGVGLVADLAGRDDTVLVVRTTSGDEARIPIDARVMPIPTIGGVSVADGEVDIAWSATPAATTAIVANGCGFGGDLCHVEGEGPTTLDDIGFDGACTISVHAFAPVQTVETSLGEVHVWVGGTASQPLPQM